MAAPILLILGAGPKIGLSVAKTFSTNGYRVVLASRSAPTIDAGQQLHVATDLAKPEDVSSVFAQVKEKLGAAPTVVVYNAAALSGGLLDKSDPLSGVAVDLYQKDLNINHISVVAALQQSIVGFQSLNDPTNPKSFIFTGNALNLVRSPKWMGFGVGKNATAYIIESLATSKVYEKDGYSFYFADERTPEGQAVLKGTDGAAAGEEYLRIAERKDQGPWLYTFTKGQGYTDYSNVKVDL